MTTWRERLAPIIVEVLDEHRDSPEPELRRALRAAWPAEGLGQRQYWPYRVWLDEIKCQRGIRPRRKLRQRSEHPCQGRLFEAGARR